MSGNQKRVQKSIFDSMTLFWKPVFIFFDSNPFFGIFAKMKQITNYTALVILYAAFLCYRAATFWLPVKLLSFNSFYNEASYVRLGLSFLSLFAFIFIWAFFSFLWAWITAIAFSIVILVASKKGGKNAD